MFDDFFSIKVESRAFFPLPIATRSKMENLFRLDLSSVRFCLTSAPQFVGAAAFAAGSDIYINPIFYSPGTPAGDAIIAHEICHLLQQQSLSAGALPMLRFQILHDARFEQDANVWACLAMLDRAVFEVFAMRQPGSASLIRVETPCFVQPWIMMAKQSHFAACKEIEKYNEANEKANKADRKKPKNPIEPFWKVFHPKTGKDAGKPLEDEFELLMDNKKVIENVTEAYKFLFNIDKLPPPVLSTLYSWVGSSDVSSSGVQNGSTQGYRGKSDWDPVAMKSRIDHKVKGEFRYYTNYYELAWALERSRPIAWRNNVTEESTIAAKILSDDSNYTANVLKDTAKKLADYLDKNKDNSDLKNALPKAPLRYAPLHKKQNYQAVIKALRTAESVKELIALFHDITDVFIAAKLIKQDEPNFKLKVATDKKAIEKVIDISKIDVRYNVGTADESSDWTLWMRDKGYPVMAGPSYTMMHMWAMAKVVGAETLEKEAMGYAMFAFWNADWDPDAETPDRNTPQSYPSSSSPVHRFHETMAGAQSEGIPYNPDRDVNSNYGAFIYRAFSNSTESKSTIGFTDAILGDTGWAARGGAT